MPLTSGSSQSVISENIRECMSSYHKTGKIGTSTPPNAVAALRQCQAIAYSHAGKSRSEGYRRLARRRKYGK